MTASRSARLVLFSLLALPLAATAADPAATGNDFAGLGALRPTSTLNLSSRQELRLTGNADPAPLWLSPYDLGSAWRTERADFAQATYRYRVTQVYGADIKLGLTASLPEAGGTRRAGPLATRNSYSALPMLHLGSESLWGERWRLSLSADSTLTGRGYALDLGLQLNYLVTPRFSLYGGYRLTEASAEVEDFYPPGFTNAANIGLRYRF